MKCINATDLLRVSYWEAQVTSRLHEPASPTFSSEACLVMSMDTCDSMGTATLTASSTALGGTSISTVRASPPMLGDQ